MTLKELARLLSSTEFLTVFGEEGRMWKGTVSDVTACEQWHDVEVLCVHSYQTPYTSWGAGLVVFLDN